MISRRTPHRCQPDLMIVKPKPSYHLRSTDTSYSSSSSSLSLYLYVKFFYLVLDICTHIVSVPSLSLSMQTSAENSMEFFATYCCIFLCYRHAEIHIIIHYELFAISYFKVAQDHTSPWINGCSKRNQSQINMASIPWPSWVLIRKKWWWWFDG